MLPPHFQSRIGAKRVTRSKLIEDFIHSHPQAANPDITALPDVTTLLVSIRSGRYTAAQVVSAYCAAAIEAHDKTNCLTEILFESALKRAKALDETLATGKLVGPLHGLPISLKDAYDVTGFDSTIGYISWTNKPAKANALAVDILIAAGAIPFVKTNCPQAMKWGETNNYVWGLTTHPINPLLSPGGSSGGEGALLALCGSMVGLGTDMGGSVRMPASNCGLYTIRPTMRRLPCLGITNCLDGLGSLESTMGPMTRSFDGTLEVTKVLVNGSGADKEASLVDLPWREEMYQSVVRKEGLLFGVMWSDGVTIPHPPNTRALEETVNALRSAGHQVVDFPSYKTEEIVARFDDFMQLDRGWDHESATAGTGEPIFPGNLSEFQPNHTQMTGREIMLLNSDRDRLRQEYLQHWNNIAGGKQLVAVLMPVTPHPAPAHNEFKNLNYTKLTSFLDYPCGGVPVVTVNESDATRPWPIGPSLGKADDENRALWDFKKFEGSPVGVQVVGRRMREEEVLGAMAVIDATLKSTSL